MYIGQEPSKARNPYLNMPTNMMVEGEKMRIIHTVLSENHSNWQDFCLALTGSKQMITRNESMCTFWFDDLKRNDKHGPDSFPDAHIVSIFYSHFTHKEKQIGHWLLEHGDTKKYLPIFYP